jgi:TolA-binding protein
MMLRLKRLLGALAYTLVILAIIPLWAASGAERKKEETAALAKQIEELQQKLERLDTRVRELERRLSPQPLQEPQNRGNTGANSPAAGEGKSHGQAAEGKAEAQPAESPSGADKEKPSISQRWRTLERGMTAESVEALLGLPQRVIEVDSKIVWYYRYPNVGAGSVVFTPDKRVAGWQKPPFHGWW